MGSSSLELSLSLKHAYMPKTIANFLSDLSNINDPSDKLLLLSDYIQKHQEELGKVGAMKRELPQCILFLMDAINTLEGEFSNIKNRMGSQSGHCSMELLSKNSRPLEVDQMEILERCRRNKNNPIYEQKQKTIIDDIQPPSLHLPTQQSKGKNMEGLSIPCEETRSSSNFLGSAEKEMINKEVSEDLGTITPRVEPSSRAGLNFRMSNNQISYHHYYHPKPLTQPIWKNNKRYWSPELHARFVEVLNLLGGIEVATPKQIRKVMQVEGLTNDQVKSHLQKYKLCNNSSIPQTKIRKRLARKEEVLDTKSFANED